MFWFIFFKCNKQSNYLKKGVLIRSSAVISLVKNKEKNINGDSKVCVIDKCEILNIKSILVNLLLITFQNIALR